jgi:hypothetical protein
MGHYLASSGGDTFSYINTIENYIDKGNYGMYLGEFYPYQNTNSANFYPMIRLPHYGIIYLIFRQVFGKETSSDLLVLLQLIAEVLSIMLFSKLILAVTKSRLSYWVSLLILTLSSWVTFYTPEFMPESFTCSFILTGIYYFHKWSKGNKNSNLFISGAFLTLSVMLKPFLFPWLLFMMIAILITVKNFVRFVKLGFLFLIPLIIYELPWVTRNYIQSKKIVLLTSPMYYPAKLCVTACSNFLLAWGGDPIWWEGKCKTAGTFFFTTDINAGCEYNFPDYAFTNDYNLDDFRIIKKEIKQLQDNPADAKLDSSIAEKFNSMRESYFRNRPFNFYVTAPLLRIKSSFVKSGSYYINPTNIFYKLLKLMQTALYWLPLIFGSTGFLIFGIRKLKDPLNVIMAGLVFSLVIVLDIVLKLNEWRYFIYTYPVFIYYMGHLIGFIEDRIRKNKTITAQV